MSEERHTGDGPRYQRAGNAPAHRAIGNAGGIPWSAEHHHSSRPAHGGEIRPRKLHLLPGQLPREPVDAEHGDAVRQNGAAAGGREQEDGQNPSHER